MNKILARIMVIYIDYTLSFQYTLFIKCEEVVNKNIYVCMYIYIHHFVLVMVCNWG